MSFSLSSWTCFLASPSPWDEAAAPVDLDGVGFVADFVFETVGVDFAGRVAGFAAVLAAAGPYLRVSHFSANITSLWRHDALFMTSYCMNNDVINWTRVYI